MQRIQVVNEAFIGTKWISAALLIAALGACEDESRPSQAQPAATPKADVDQVTDDPLRFLGKRVTVSGEVDKIHGPRALELEGEGIWWDDTLLVLTRAPVNTGGQALAEDDDVTVTGVVRKLTVVEVERDIGWDLQQELEVRFRDRPVLVADTISVSEARAVWSEKEFPQGTIMGLMLLWTTPDPTALAGHALTIRDVPVRSKSGKAMWVGFNDLAQILVVPNNAEALNKIAAGQRVTISGTVEKMPPAPRARTQWSLPAQMQAQIARVPVYINATRVEEATQGQTGQQGQPGQQTAPAPAPTSPADAAPTLQIRPGE